METCMIARPALNELYEHTFLTVMVLQRSLEHKHDMLMQARPDEVGKETAKTSHGAVPL